jgi:hypothetical protein
MIQVELPHHLRTLAQVSGAVTLEVDEPVTLRRVLDALEARYPVLRGTIRDHGTLERRSFLRFFVCREDWSHEPVDAPLPEAVATGKEPLLVIGAIAGGLAPSASLRADRPGGRPSRHSGLAMSGAAMEAREP